MNRTHPTARFAPHTSHRNPLSEEENCNALKAKPNSRKLTARKYMWRALKSNSKFLKPKAPKDLTRKQRLDRRNASKGKLTRKQRLDRRNASKARKERLGRRNDSKAKLKFLKPKAPPKLYDKNTPSNSPEKNRTNTRLQRTDVKTPSEEAGNKEKTTRPFERSLQTKKRRFNTSTDDDTQLEEGIIFPRHPFVICQSVRKIAGLLPPQEDGIRIDQIPPNRSFSQVMEERYSPHSFPKSDSAPKSYTHLHLLMYHTGFVFLLFHPPRVIPTIAWPPWTLKVKCRNRLKC